MEVLPDKWKERRRRIGRIKKRCCKFAHVQQRNIPGTPHFKQQ
jgi:hypothetical protein